MASYLPPTENLPIFDNQVFDINNTTALTYAEAKKYFVTYPISQGTTTISDLIAGSLTYLTPASGSFFEIGTNQVSGGTIRIGPTGGSSGVSVHCGNIDFKNNTINNATSGTTGNLNLGDSQTTGILNIGTGIRTGVGAINIGTNVSTTAPINIGASGSTTTVTGSLAITKPLSLPTTSITPSIGQLGYSVGVKNTAVVNLAAATLTNLLTTGTSPTILPLGTLLISWTVTATFSPATNTSSMTFTFQNSAGTTIVGTPSNTTLTLTGAPSKSTFTYTAIVTTTATANDGEIILQGTTSAATTASIAVGCVSVSWVKIA